MRRAILAILPLLCACEGDAENAVRRNMLDPDAAQFRDVRRCSGDREVWLGEVNGKNSYGAYTGFKPFYYGSGTVAYPDDAEFMTLMGRCFSDLKDAPPTPSAVPSIAEAPPAAPPPKMEKAPANAGKEAATDFDAEEEGPGRPNLAAQDQCWMDYCPCDTSDRDYGGADVVVCRNLRAGVAVSNEMTSGAAGMRDVRRQIREHRETYGGW